MKKEAFVCVVVALIAATAVAASFGGTSATPTCKTSDLVVWIDTGAGNGAAGSTYVTLKFTNQAAHTCTLGGYPGVSAVDLRGRRLGTPGSRTPSTRRLIRLANGATASATLRIVVAGNFPAASCHRRAAAGVRVYPPNQTASKIVPIPFEACSLAGPVILNVSAVTS